MRALAVALVLSLLILALAPSAAADDDSLKVVVLVEDKSYSVGTTGKVTVHVFDKGAHADSDEAPFVQMGIFPIRTLNVTKKATGVYEGSFTLQSDDIYRGMAMISASATLGKANQSDTTFNEDSDVATLTLPQSASTGLQVDCHPFSVSDGALRPGAAVTIETVVTSNGTPVSPSYFRLVVTYYDRNYNEIEETLNTTNASTGVLRAAYKLPDLPYDVDLTFEASAKYQSDIKDDSLTLSLDFFNVIYHHASKTSTSTTFDLYIADVDGKAVKGAEIFLSYWPDSSGSSMKSVGPLTTDSGGRVRPTLAFSEGAKVLHVEGTANASGRSQEFSGTIRLVAEPASVPKPSGDEFQVIPAGDESYYPAGSTVNRDYYAFNDSKAWAGKQVYCYIVTKSYSLTPPSITPISVEARTITTDTTGKFRLSVKPPAGKDSYIQAYFESPTGIHPKPGGYISDHDSADGQYYSSDTDNFLTSITTPGKVVKVTVKELKLGAPSQVEASARSGDPPLAAAAWGVGEVSNILDPSVNTGNWAIWNEVPSMLSRSGSRYTGTITIPSFMPQDSKYTVMVMLESDDSIPTYGLATLRPGEGTDTGGFPWLYIILVIVIIVVVLVAVVALMKRRRAPVPPSEVVNFAGAPAVTQPPAVPPGGAVAPGETAGPQGPGAPPPPPPPPQPTAQQYQQSAPQQYPPPPPPYQQPAPQQYPAQAPPPQYQQPPPQYQPQPAYVAAPPPTGPLPPPSRQGKVAMPNNAMCAFCNQWLLQGTPGIMCQCGKCYHEHCAKIQEKCSHCGTKLAV